MLGTRETGWVILIRLLVSLVVFFVGAGRWSFDAAFSARAARIRVSGTAP